MRFFVVETLENAYLIKSSISRKFNYILDLWVLNLFFKS